MRRFFSPNTGSLPNLIIIGAMKSGTSSLHFYLDQHPDVQMSRTKELHFFIEENNWSRGLDWYRSHFSQRFPVRGESTPAYTHFPFRRGVPQRIHEIIPEARLIYVVRDPMERTLSHYVHAVSAGRESRPVDQAVTNPDEPYVTRSRYFTQIAQYLEYFPPEQILIVNTYDLLRNRSDVVSRAFDFVGVDASFDSEQFSRMRGKGGDKRRPTPTGARLSRFLDRTLSSLPSEVRDRIKRPILLPFTRAMPKPDLGDRAREELRRLLAEDVGRFREWTDDPLTGWSI